MLGFYGLVILIKLLSNLGFPVSRFAVNFIMLYQLKRVYDIINNRFRVGNCNYPVYVALAAELFHLA